MENAALLVVIITLCGVLLWRERGGTPPVWWYDRREPAPKRVVDHEVKRLREWMDDDERTL